jgi:GNAT superfamily N-acetyltransferase
MDYLIRPLDETDYEAIIQLWADAGLPYKPAGRDSLRALRREFKRRDSCYLGMFDGGRLIGVVIGASDGRKGWISRLAVHPDYRGRGLAGKLIEEVERFLYSLGLKVLACLIEDYNTPSMSAFIKAGYICGRNILYFSKRGSHED